MKIVSFNIQYGLGADGNYDVGRIPPAVAGADIIALQEVDRFWQRSGMVDQPAAIARALPDYYWIYGPNLDMDASYRDENGHLINRRKQFGNMLLSKTPFISSRNHLLPKPGTVTHHGIQQGVLEGVVEWADGPLRLYSIHLNHLSPKFRCEQLAAFLNIHTGSPARGGIWSGGHPDNQAGWIEEAIPPMPDRAILMGDFNMTFDSAEYSMLAGPMSDRLGRVGALDGFADAWTLAGNEESEGETCFRKPGEKRGSGRIDYCFVTPEFSDSIKDVRVDTECRASDHQPVWTTIK